MKRFRFKKKKITSRLSRHSLIKLSCCMETVSMTNYIAQEKQKQLITNHLTPFLSTHL